MNALFQNRADAGLALAGLARKHAGPDTVVLGLDRGGLMVAAELARWLGVPFDLLPVLTFVLPFDPRAPVGAVGPENICVLDDEWLDLLDVEADAIHALRTQAEADLVRWCRLVLGERALPRLGGRTVILVEDLVASTLRVRAAVLHLRQHGPHRVILAAPVVTRTAAREVHPLLDEIIAIDTPDAAPPLGRVYARPELPDDAELRRVLRVPEPVAEALPDGDG